MDIRAFRQQYPQYKSMSDEQLATSLHKKYYSDIDFNEFKGRFLGKAQAIPEQSSIVDTLLTGPRTALHALQGLKQGIDQAGGGVAQTISAGLEKVGLFDEGSTQQMTDTMRADRQAFAQSPAGQSFGGKTGRFVGEIAPWMLLPAGAAARGLKGISGVLGGAAASGLAGGGIGASQFSDARPEAGQEYLDALLSQKADQATTGAKWGAGLGLLFGIPGAALGRVNDAFVKRMSASPETASAVQQGLKRQVPVFTSDVSTPFVSRTGELLEYAPVGMVTKRLAQNKAARVAAEQFTASSQKAMMAANFGGRTGLKRLQAVAASGGKRAKTAQALLDDIQNAGDDWNQIIQTSGNVKLFRAKLIADQRFEKVRQLADEAGAFGAKDKAQERADKGYGFTGAAVDKSTAQQTANHNRNVSNRTGQTTTTNTSTRVDPPKKEPNFVQKIGYGTKKLATKYLGLDKNKTKYNFYE